MRRLGARVFVGDLDSRRLLAEVDPASQILWTEFRPATGLAVGRPRVIRDDRRGAEILRQATATFGPGTYALVLLVPHEVEARILALFERELSRQGRALGEFVSIRGSYQQGPRGLALRLDEAIERSGRRLPLSATLDLVS
jgi:hypothetical protein